MRYVVVSAPTYMHIYTLSNYNKTPLHLEHTQMIFEKYKPVPPASSLQKACRIRWLLDRLALPFQYLVKYVGPLMEVYVQY